MDPTPLLRRSTRSLRRNSELRFVLVCENEYGAVDQGDCLHGIALAVGGWRYWMHPRLFGFTSYLSAAQLTSGKLNLIRQP